MVFKFIMPTSVPTTNLNKHPKEVLASIVRYPDAFFEFIFWLRLDYRTNIEFRIYYDAIADWLSILEIQSPYTLSAHNDAPWNASTERANSHIAAWIAQISAN